VWKAERHDVAEQLAQKGVSRVAGQASERAGAERGEAGSELLWSGAPAGKQHPGRGLCGSWLGGRPSHGVPDVAAVQGPCGSKLWGSSPTIGRPPVLVDKPPHAHSLPPHLSCLA